MISSEVLSHEEKQQLIVRVAASSLFRKSPRLREFLLYAGECTLSNRLGDVREQVIAEKVFQRNTQSYDLQDSIVRAEARNLRKRLEKYFETEGLEESVLVTMPKGGYALAFEPRPQESQPQTTKASNADTASEVTINEFAAPLSHEFVGSQEPSRSSAYSRLLLVLSICLAFLATVASALAVRWYPGDAGGVSTPLTRARSLPFSALFDNKQDTVIVTSDTAFLQISQLEGRRLSLDDYLAHAYPDVPRLTPRDVIQRLNRSQYTDGAEMTIAGLIMRRNANFLERTFLRSGRQVTLSDFKSRNVILLGSPASNPWANLYAANLNFQFAVDDQGGIKFRNRSPGPGEWSLCPSPQDNQLNRTYAQVAFLPSTSPENGNVLLLAGTTAEATAAAGEFLLNEAAFTKTMKTLGIDPAGKPRYFEILLRATTFVGGNTQSEVVGYRLRPFSIP